MNKAVNIVKIPEMNFFNYLCWTVQICTFNKPTWFKEGHMNV